jgi:hypothetical protein
MNLHTGDPLYMYVGAPAGMVERSQRIQPDRMVVTMSHATEEITDYLTRYAATLTSFDAEAAAELWTTPGLILDDNFAGAVESQEALARGLEQSYPLYRRLGLASVGFELRGQQQLSQVITLIRVHWLFFDVDGNQLTDSHSHYILRRDETGYRACVCIQIDDTDKLQSLMAERGVGLIDPTAP